MLHSRDVPSALCAKERRRIDFSATKSWISPLAPVVTPPRWRVNEENGAIALCPGADQTSDRATMAARDTAPGCKQVSSTKLVPLLRAVASSLDWHYPEVMDYGYTGDSPQVPRSSNSHNSTRPPSQSE